MNAALFPNHPAAMQQQHPGMPHGQPMGPGQVHPQSMGQPMMHPGVSAAGGPHVTQGGPMMAMQPGMGPGGPNAHAMSHLNPGAQMAQQNMQQQPCKSTNQHSLQSSVPGIYYVLLPQKLSDIHSYSILSC
jgi:hypothetical protein